MRRKRVSSALADLLRQVPGYDPFETAGDAWLDEDAAQRAIDFFPECLKHVEGAVAGQPFVLEPWQQAIVGNIFGWKRKNDRGIPVRRYREVFTYVPRKNGKTPLAAGICIYVLFCDGEPGAQIYSAAAEREQAALLYRHAKGMVEQESELNSRAKVYGGSNHRSIVLKADEASVYKVLSADADTKHGGNSHLIVMDELHAQPNRDLVDVLQTSMASANRLQPLMIYITTADYDRPSICNEKYEYAGKVRDGVIDDQRFLPVIYEAKQDDDWTSPEVWATANPNLGVSVSLEYLERECLRAKETPAYENTFRRLHLNQKTQQDVRWLRLEQWDATSGLRPGEEPDEWRKRVISEYLGQPVYCGLDLASSQDLTAFCCVWEIDGGRVVLPWFWVPAEGAKQREDRDRVPYQTWARQGWVRMVEGSTMDYDVLLADLEDIGEQFQVAGIAIDRWNATHVATRLDAAGVNVCWFGQGYASMSSPAKELERAVVSETVWHGGNPVLRWMASHVAVEMDPAGNLKPSKKKSTERIDGIVCAIMAIGIAMQAPQQGPQLIVL